MTSENDSNAQNDELVFRQPSSYEDLFEINSSALIGHLMEESGRDAYEAEYEMWLEKLRCLPSYKDDVVRRQADEAYDDLDMTVTKNDDMERVAAIYAGLTRGRKAVADLKSVVSMRAEVLKDATKSLKSGARGMFKGTEKDKDASCDRMVRHLVGELAQAKALQTYLEDRLDQIDFATMQSARVLRERQEQMRSNYGFIQDGLNHNYKNQAVDANDDDPLPPQYRRRG